MDLELDFTRELLQREVDYRNNVQILRGLGLTGELPSFDQVDGAASRLSNAAIDFLRQHCKSPTLIVVPPVSIFFDDIKKPSLNFDIGIIAQLDLQFQDKSIGQVCSMLFKLLDYNDLRFLHIHEWRVLREMIKLSGAEAVPGGTYFPLYPGKPDSYGRISVVSLIGDIERLLKFPRTTMIPLNITYYVAAMIGTS